MRLLLQWENVFWGIFPLNTKPELKHAVNRFVRCVIRQCSIIFRKTLSALWDMSGVFVYISVLDIIFQDNSKIRSFYMLSFFSISTYNGILSQVYALLAKSDHGCMNVMDICSLYWTVQTISTNIHSTFNLSMYSIPAVDKNYQLY